MCGIDGLAGPSEVLVVADASATRRTRRRRAGRAGRARSAGARRRGVARSRRARARRGAARRAVRARERARRDRRARARRARRGSSTRASDAEVLDVIERFAPEHLSLMVARSVRVGAEDSPRGRDLRRRRHAGRRGRLPRRHQPHAADVGRGALLLGPAYRRFPAHDDAGRKHPRAHGRRRRAARRARRLRRPAGARAHRADARLLILQECPAGVQAARCACFPPLLVWPLPSRCSPARAVRLAPARAGGDGIAAPFDVATMDRGANACKDFFASPRRLAQGAPDCGRLAGTASRAARRPHPPDRARHARGGAEAARGRRRDGQKIGTLYRACMDPRRRATRPGADRARAGAHSALTDAGRRSRPRSRTCTRSAWTPASRSARPRTSRQHQGDRQVDHSRIGLPERDSACARRRVGEASQPVPRPRAQDARAEQRRRRGGRRERDRGVRDVPGARLEAGRRRCAIQKRLPPALDAGGCRRSRRTRRSRSTCARPSSGQRHRQRRRAPFLQTYDRALATAPLATWRAYLRWRLLNAYASALPKRFDQRTSTSTAGCCAAAGRLPRWKRSSRSTTAAQRGGRARVRRQEFSPEAERARFDMTIRVRDAYGRTSGRSPG